MRSVLRGHRRAQAMASPDLVHCQLYDFVHMSDTDYPLSTFKNGRLPAACRRKLTLPFTVNCVNMRVHSSW